MQWFGFGGTSALLISAQLNPNNLFITANKIFYSIFPYNTIRTQSSLLTEADGGLSLKNLILKLQNYYKYI
jgi:hypothetical protein